MPSHLSLFISKYLQNIHHNCTPYTETSPESGEEALRFKMEESIPRETKVMYSTTKEKFILRHLRRRLR